MDAIYVARSPSISIAYDLRMADTLWNEPRLYIAGQLREAEGGRTFDT